MKKNISAIHPNTSGEGTPSHGIGKLSHGWHWEVPDDFPMKTSVDFAATEGYSLVN
jgi:hypothetical protein